jgi:glycosyltransferase involved in cell wall biosynthesis
MWNAGEQPVPIVHCADLAPERPESSSIFSCASTCSVRRTVVTTSGRTSHDIVRRFAAGGMRVVDLDLGLASHPSLRAHYDATVCMRDRLRRLQPRIVHTHGAFHNVLGAVAARWAGVPHIMTEDAGPPPARRRDRWTMRWAARLPDVAFVPTRVAADARRAVVNGAATRVMHLPHGVDLRRFAPAPGVERHAARCALAVPAEAFVVGAVGNLLARKRLDVLVDAMPLILDRVPQAWFLIAGDGPELVALQRQARQLGVESRLRCTGWLDDIVAAYRALDVFLLLGDGRQETGLTLAEAMACGVPALVRRSPLAQELCGERAAIQLDARPRDVARRIVELAQNGSDRSRLAALARSHALRHFDITSSARLLEEIYAHCVARPHRPHPPTTLPPTTLGRFDQEST